MTGPTPQGVTPPETNALNADEGHSVNQAPGTAPDEPDQLKQDRKRKRAEHVAAADDALLGAPKQISPARVKDVLEQTGMEIKRLEMEMLAADSVIMGIGFSEGDLATADMSEALSVASKEFTGVCGETVNMLVEITFREGSAEPPVHNLAEVAEVLRRPEDANLAIRAGTHAFFVERRDKECRILQSYLGRYSLTESLNGDARAGTTTIAADELACRLETIGAHHLDNRRTGQPFRPHAHEMELFGGALVKESDVLTDRVKLRCDSTTDILPAEDQLAKVHQRLKLHAASWADVRSTKLNPLAWSLAKLPEPEKREEPQVEPLSPSGLQKQLEQKLETEREKRAERPAKKARYGDHLAVTPKGPRMT